MIAVKMGGRIAEEIALDQVTTGANDDLEKATGLARKMVCEWGMSQRMGPLTFGHKEEQVFLGRDIARQQDYSEDTAIKIDQEVKRIVEDNYQRARKILTDNQDLLEQLAEALLEREILTAEDVQRIVDGLPLEAQKSVTQERTEERDEKETDEEKEHKTPLPPPILQNPGSVPQS